MTETMEQIAVALEIESMIPIPRSLQQQPEALTSAEAERLRRRAEWAARQRLLVVQRRKSATDRRVAQMVDLALSIAKKGR